MSITREEWRIIRATRKALREAEKSKALQREAMHQHRIRLLNSWLRKRKERFDYLDMEADFHRAIGVPIPNDDE